MTKKVAIGIALVLLMAVAIRAVVIRRNDVAFTTWNLQTSALVGALAYSHDGTQLAVYSATNAGTDIWDVNQKRVIKHLSESGIWLGKELIQFSPNGQFLAMCPANSLELIDTSSWNVVRPTVDGGCQNASFTPDSKKLIVVTGNFSPYGDGDNIEVFDTATWTIVDAIRTVTKRISTATDRMGCKGPLLVPPHMMSIHPERPGVFFNPYGVFAISKDGRFIALSGQAEDICDESNASPHLQKAATVIIDLETRKPVRVFEEFADSLDWSPDGTRLAAGIGNGEAIRIYDVSSGAIIASEPGIAHTLVRYTPDGQYLIEQVKGKVEIWDSAHHQLLQTIDAEASAIAISPDGKSFALGGGDPSIFDAIPLVSLFVHPNGGKGRMMVYRLK
jgi:WD40 repeat protein